MARVAQIKGDVQDIVTVIPKTVEYSISTVEDENVRVTPIILGKVQNTSAFEIPKVIVDYLVKQGSK